jgi:hypothetical protein
LLHKHVNDIKSELEEQESLLKNVSQMDEYKNLIEHIDMINNVIQTVEILRQYEAYLNGKFFFYIPS